MVRLKFKYRIWGKVIQTKRGIQSLQTVRLGPPRTHSTWDKIFMEECPHCNQPGLKTSRKFILSPVKSATCESCDEKIGIPPGAMLYYLPFFIALFAVLLFSTTMIKLLVLPLIFIGIGTVQMKLSLIKG